MSKAMQEEILATLGAIAAIGAFGFGFNAWGCFFAVKAVVDCVCALGLAWQEFKEEKKATA